MRRNKHVLCGGMGFLGGAVGALTAELLPEWSIKSALLRIGYVGIWAPRETTVLSLGPRPISIGGGDDHVHVSGLPQRAATITLQEGRIFYTDTVTGAKTEFRDGSRIKVGKIEMVVHAKK